MPGEEYSPLQQLLLETDLVSVKTLAEICHTDRQPLAVALLSVFRAEGREIELLRELNDAEVIELVFISILRILSVKLFLRWPKRLKLQCYLERRHCQQH